MADPVSGTVVCHNDVEPSNVVFRNGRAAALIDFEFAAPGRPLHDLAHLARLWAPIEDDVDRQRLGWRDADGPRRVRLIADTYGLDDEERLGLLSAIDAALDQVEHMARTLVAVDPASLASVERTGGLQKYDRRRRWWAANRSRFAAALV